MLVTAVKHYRSTRNGWKGSQVQGGRSTSSLGWHGGVEEDQLHKKHHNDPPARYHPLSPLKGVNHDMITQTRLIGSLQAWRLQWEGEREEGLTGCVWGQSWGGQVEGKGREISSADVIWLFKYLEGDLNQHWNFGASGTRESGRMRWADRLDPRNLLIGHLLFYFKFSSCFFNFYIFSSWCKVSWFKLSSVHYRIIPKGNTNHPWYRLLARL